MIYVDNKQDKMWDALMECDTEMVMMAFTNYHGMQLLNDGFYKFLIEEGIMEGDGEEEDNE